MYGNHFYSVRSHRKSLFFVLAGLEAIFLVSAMRIGAADSRSEVESPQMIVKQLCEMDARGERLTRQGWYEAAPMFLRSQPFSTNRADVIVKRGDCQAISSEIHGNEATVGVEYLTIGRLDPSMRLSWDTRPPGPVKLRSFYTLVFTNAYWVVTGQNHTIQHVNGPSEWKIKEFQPEQVVSIAAAIRYVRAVEQTATDPTVKRNAEQTMAILSRYR